LVSPPKALTADVSISYFANTSGTKLRAHAGNAYRAPSLFERFRGGFFNDFVTGQPVFSAYGDPFLSPDRYNSIDGGLDQYLWGDRVRISATYFYTRGVTITALDLGTTIQFATDPYGRTSGYIPDALPHRPLLVVVAGVAVNLGELFRLCVQSPSSMRKGLHTA
jgi:iron complex outermembrane receptor protein